MNATSSNCVVNRMDDEFLPKLFSISIFLYPFSIASHTAYVIPQFIIVLYLLPKIALFKPFPPIRKGLILASIVGAIVSAALVEATSDKPSYELVSKLLINGLTFCVLVITGKRLVSEASIDHLRAAAIFWAVIALIIYAASGTTFDSIIILFAANDAVDSSSLYHLASPLEDFFLTKNVAAMFFVATFSLYLCLHLQYKRILSKVGVAFFLVSITVFASRQAIISALTVIILYRSLKGINIAAVVSVAICVLVGAIFFAAFFDLGSSGDGANQRLELWAYFFKNFSQFGIGGYGLEKLNSILNSAVGIDNFHMFFMNQIGAYGLIHFILFSAFCYLVVGVARRSAVYILPISGYYLNVLFQTYGYEYGNLFLFMFVITDYYANCGRRRSHEPSVVTTSSQAAHSL